RRPRYSPSIKPQPHLMRITPTVVRRWIPNLGLWGVGAGAFVTLAASSIPRFQDDVLKKIPGIASYYQSDIPDSDKPF
ncbi:cytochrome b-c1 complex subunit 10, partial [Phakopsora pachyrhizi]